MITRRNLLSFLALTALGASLPPALTGCLEAGEGNAATLEDIPAEPTKLVVFLFDTVIQIQAYCSDETMKLVEKRLNFFENTFSKTVEGSDIHRINHAAGAPTIVEPETADIIERSIRYSEASDGLFDITIGGVMELWDFVEEVVPHSDELAEALTHVGYETIVVEGRTVQLLDPETKIDLGAIAKGYIADDIVSLFKSQGCTEALINLGGNTYALGSKPDGSPWKVGIQDPNQARGTMFAATSVIDKSVVTSGINERCFTKDGVFYHHILDPQTGMPVDNGIASTTIVSDRSVDGDGYTTITFLLDIDEGLAAVEDHGGLQVLFVETDGTITASEDLEVESL